MQAVPAKEPSQFGKFIAASILVTLAAVGLTIGCKTTDVPVAKDPGSIVADAKICATAPVHDLALDTLDDFATALVTANYAGAVAAVVTGIARSVYDSLKERAQETAWKAAKCAITALQEQTTKHVNFGAMDAATMQRERLLLENADAWIQAH